MSEEKKDEALAIKVVDSEGAEVFFRIKPKMALRKLMEAYCKRNGTTMDGLRFLFDGDRVNGDQTPEQLGMEEGSQIDVAVEQKGG
jgi:small ubiquitin-related modifier